MNNKVLVELLVPIIEEKYDVFLPVNRKVGEIIKILSKLVSELSGGYFVPNSSNLIYNGDSGEPYPLDKIILETNIRNGTTVVLL